MSLIISGLVGAIVGWLSAKTFFAHSWTALIPWALLGLANGAAARPKKTVLWAGATYGFILPIAFTIFGYHGSGLKPAFFGLLLVLGVVGAGCGMVLALIGTRFRRTTPQSPTPPLN